MAAVKFPEYLMAASADIRRAYLMGFDCAFSGPDAVNSHDSFLATAEQIRAWRLGKADGEDSELLARRHTTPLAKKFDVSLGDLLPVSSAHLISHSGRTVAIVSDRLYQHLSLYAVIHEIPITTALLRLRDELQQAA